MRNSDAVVTSETDPVASDGRRSIGAKELTALLAMMMSMVALAVDIMLPAFGDIRSEFGLEASSTEAAAIITAFLLGLAVTQVAYGLAADRFGRKPVLYAGMALYALGAAVSMIAPSLTWLLVGRFIWGAGAAAPRILTLSILRDIYSGELMARAMSFVMAVFILVPVAAPSIGAVLTDWISWRGAVGFTLVVAVVVLVWTLRLPETLKPENRIGLSRVEVWKAARTVFTNRATMGYTLMSTVLFGSFASYLATSELIFSDVFDLGDQFPLIFGGLAIVMGIAVLINSGLVGRVGLQPLIGRLVIGYVAVSAALVVLALASDGHPPFWAFAGVLGLVLASHSLLIPNVNTAAMIPMALVAGTASAIIGTITTALGAGIGSSIDRSFDGSVTPLSVAFLLVGLVAWALSIFARRGLETEETSPVPIKSR